MKRTVLALTLLIGGLYAPAQQKNKLSAGQWRGELERTDGNNIIFNFEVSKNAGKPIIYVRNAAERLAVDDITVQDDSVFIRLPFFDSQFRAVFTNDKQLQGVWIKRLADRNLVMPFFAVNEGEKSYRFNAGNTKPAANITGRWATTFFIPGSERTVKAVGVFNQAGTALTGSFLTPSGDYRYLEGVVDGDSLKLSGFDGGYAMLFTAKIDDAKKISGGKYFSGAGIPREWEANKDAAAALAGNSSSGLLKQGTSPKLNFTFNDVDGKPVSVNEHRFKDKVVIVQLLGSWCPNCMDETVFMNQIYQRYKSKGVEILGLAYERTADFTRSQQSVKNFMKRLKVAYPVLITPVAVSDPQRAEKTLPQLEKIPAFPTTIFVNRKGEIQKIHAGFNGPGTGADYEKQKREYIEIIEDLLAQQ
ncbi:TlpA disulfide reductase family protein [Agriterribacter sp.]|uniref:peroxiredoxin family protein n=1 Tax=Agriterribacter sp. TaxID=2821509 RepID=UPI002BE07E89|nr:TlpA disulfide reductase family protein [Agriterribacter sp.]HTN08157.1 TlpA disulfide reductase family protein [Agriterribacter sp.]